MSTPRDTGERAEPVRQSGKGRPTPKRRDARRQRRTGPAAPPPKNRREAYQRTKEEQRAGRAERRAGMARGEDRYLLARDRGPLRRHIRDLVDARRSALSFFLPAAVLLFIGTLVPVVAVRSAALTLWFAAVIMMIFDGVLIARMTVKSVKVAFPEHTERTRSLVFYAVSRSTQLRRFRTPKPQAKA